MRILFGPAHDALHVDPAAPGAYEWWYFDALSDNGRFAVVAIFFLGSPMSPYYKAVATNKAANARDFCGVFVSVHERVAHECWRERAYAYNLYRNGAFSSARPEAAVGGSAVTSEAAAGGSWRWQVHVDEPGLWTGRARLDLTFVTAAPPDLSPMGDDSADHTWVCVAPVCRAEGTLAPPSGQKVAFSGSGYHDHNFGRLPFTDTGSWYWGRAPLVCDDGKMRTGVFYALRGHGGAEQITLLTFDEHGGALAGTAAPVAAAAPALTRPVRSAYGLRHATVLNSAVTTATPLRLQAVLHPERGAFSEGPFYRRLPLTLEARAEQNNERLWTGTGEGIGEVFRPAGLCGPVASRAMWSRIRRRNPK